MYLPVGPELVAWRSESRVLDHVLVYYNYCCCVVNQVRTGTGFGVRVNHLFSVSSPDVSFRRSRILEDRIVD
jgi:hypothetical protein